MNRTLIIGLVIVALSVAAFFTLPALANGPVDGDAGTPGDAAWQEMHEACEEGNWEAMAEAAAKFHADTDDNHCDGNGYEEWGGMMSGMMR